MLWLRSLCVITFVYNLESSDSIRWPAGTYGIPKSASGCPLTDGFKWQEGWRSQDTNDEYSDNKKSGEFHLDAVVDRKKVKRSFCSKTSTTGDHNRSNWPPGQYCIYQVIQCPTGFTSGYVFWDDDDFGNVNEESGTLPNGEYDGDTKIYFCCRADGNKDDPILLPSKSPFFLLAYKSSKCQMVKWAVASVEWIYYDTEDWNNADDREGAFPYEAGKAHPTIYYCYYRGCNETLTAVNGTFHSPNYPRQYPDGQYCSWTITVCPAQQIRLIFTNFRLQNESNTDALHVYDGENATGGVLGVFYGGHPPPQEGVYSSSNKMFLIFKSDNTDSYKGFSASYFAVNKSGLSVTTTQTPDMTLSSPLTPKTTYTLESTAFTRNPASTIDGRTKEGGEKDERKQYREKGFNVVAVIVPVVLVVFLVAGLIAAFFYCKRKRTKKATKPDEVIFSARSSDESPIVLENPYYDRKVVIANAKQPNVSEGHEMYTDVSEPEKLNKAEPYKNQENENPLYEGVDADDAVLNPIYGSELVMTNPQGSSFCEGNELYTDVEEPDANNEKKLYMEQESDNPLYEVTGTDDAVFNPIYDSSI